MFMQPKLDTLLLYIHKSVPIYINLHLSFSNSFVGSKETAILKKKKKIICHRKRTIEHKSTK